MCFSQSMLHIRNLRRVQDEALRDSEESGVTSGMHSLRHALARRLLEEGTPLSTVVDVMGHVQYDSATPYLKVDIAGLRTCALSLNEVTKDA